MPSQKEITENVLATRLMADLIGISAIGLQCSLMIIAVDFYRGRPLPLPLTLGIFVVLSIVATLIWHRQRSWQTPEQWRRPLLASLIVGLAFFATDVLLSSLHGETNPLHFPGGLLGLPLTIAIFPCFTIICVAGLLRALYILKATNGGT